MKVKIKDYNKLRGKPARWFCNNKTNKEPKVFTDFDGTATDTATTQ